MSQSGSGGLLKKWYDKTADLILLLVKFTMKKIPATLLTNGNRTLSNISFVLQAPYLVKIVIRGCKC